MKNRKKSVFLIFIGLLFIGCSFYEMYVGDIPFIDNIIRSFNSSDVIGPPIGVEKLSSIEFTNVSGEAYLFDKEAIDDNVNNKFFLNIKIGDDPYRLSFKYPDYISLFVGIDEELVFGNDYININFRYDDDTYEEYIEKHKKIDPDDDYFTKNFSANNDISKIYITDIVEGTDELFINKVNFRIYDLNEKGKPLTINMLVKNKMVPDSLLLNIYNSFTFEKIDNDLKFCKEKGNNYYCTFKLNNYDNSLNNRLVLELDKNMFTIEEPENVLVPSTISVDLKEGDKKQANIDFKVLYDSTGAVKRNLERYEYVEETINGHVFMVKEHTLYSKTLYQEIAPNIYVRIVVDAEDGFLDAAIQPFTKFRVY